MTVVRLAYASALLALIVGCAYQAPKTASASASTSSSYLGPKQFFSFWKARTTRKVGDSDEVLQQVRSDLFKTKRASTIRAQTELAARSSESVQLSDDCYADIECFNASLTITLADKYKADWADSLNYLESYFANVRVEISGADSAVNSADDVEDKLAAFLRRDQTTRKLYGETLNDPTLEQHASLTRDLGFGWIRSQVRSRDLEASEWLLKTSQPLANDDRADLFESAWPIIQHADRRPALQYFAVSTLRTTKFPSSNAKEWAMLVDRVELNLGRPQIYGTQVRCMDGEYRFSPTIDDSAVNERREEIGLERLKVDVSKSLGAC